MNFRLPGLVVFLAISIQIIHADSVSRSTLDEKKKIDMAERVYVIIDKHEEITLIVDGLIEAVFETQHYNLVGFGRADHYEWIDPIDPAMLKKEKIEANLTWQEVTELAKPLCASVFSLQEKELVRPGGNFISYPKVVPQDGNNLYSPGYWLAGYYWADSKTGYSTFNDTLSFKYIEGVGVLYMERKFFGTLNPIDFEPIDKEKARKLARKQAKRMRTLSGLARFFNKGSQEFLRADLVFVHPNNIFDIDRPEKFKESQKHRLAWAVAYGWKLDSEKLNVQRPFYIFIDAETGECLGAYG